MNILNVQLDYCIWIAFSKSIILK